MKIRHPQLFLSVFQALGEIFKKLNTDSVYVIDNFPIAACDNIRIRRVRRYHGEAYHGCIASKRRYFYGLRIHALVTGAGEPVEVFLAPGAEGRRAGAASLSVMRE